jgi:oxygen-independent coproporphyrinogen-3 oxidase
MSTISLYIHIPFCTRRCPYCSFFRVRAGRKREAAFVPALVSEIETGLRRRPAGTRLETVYFGGGTPSVLSASGWQRVFGALAPYRDETAGAEITCELNPEDVTERLVTFLRDLGINRISLGVQSMEAGSQRRLGRCDPDVNRAAIETVRRRFANVSFDLLLGVPGRPRGRIRSTIAELAAAEPAHWSVYCLEPGGDAGDGSVDFWERVDPERSAGEYLLVCDELRSRGYHHYEVSSWARPGRECRHNRVYWSGGDYLGVGPAAHSCIGGERYSNPASLQSYLEFSGSGDPLRDRRTPADVETERVMLGLRTAEGLAAESLRCPDGVLDAILAEGLAVVAGGRFRLTDRGFLVLNEVALRVLAV